MRLSKLSLALASSLLLIAGSCKKSDDGGGGNLSADGLNAGKSAITFNTSSSGFGSFNSSNTPTSSATRTNSGSLDIINLTAAETGTSGVKTAQLTITLPANSSTASGNINSDFSTPTGATVEPVMLIGSATLSGSESYASETGTLTITKLTSTEVEGNFSGSFSNSTTKTTTNVTNGQFAGKF